MAGAAPGAEKGDRSVPGSSGAARLWSIVPSAPGPVHAGVASGTPSI
jgi:hypothetical protein